MDTSRLDTADDMISVGFVLGTCLHVAKLNLQAEPKHKAGMGKACAETKVRTG